VRIAMGFDSYPLGQNARELIRMIDGGLTPMEGIVAATSNAAAALGLGDVGAVVPGAVADLVVLDGDPLSEPAVLLDADRIRFVVQGGEILAAAPCQR
jgi:imidazolonepropionase-like amidohydrolase